MDHVVQSRRDAADRVTGLGTRNNIRGSGQQHSRQWTSLKSNCLYREVLSAGCVLVTGLVDKQYLCPFAEMGSFAPDLRKLLVDTKLVSLLHKQNVVALRQDATVETALKVRLFPSVYDLMELGSL